MPTKPIRDEIVMFLAPDVAGMMRGRAAPTSELPRCLKRGLALPPVVQAISPFSDIAPGSPWGPMDDVSLIGDPEAQVRVDLWDDAAPLHFFLCNWHDTVTGKPWENCVRVFLKRALADLEKEAGLRVRIGVELEFHLSGMAPGPGPCFTLHALRVGEPTLSQMVAALKQAGTEPETFEPEYGVGQYEVSCRPALGVAGADRIAIMREVIREVARRNGLYASFAPKVALDAVGNGVHVHMSLEDKKGKPISYDPKGPGGMSKVFGQFLAGILHHSPALTVFGAPSPASYLRLVPGHWSSSYAAVGTANREVTMRLPSVWGGVGKNPAKSFNVEYRPVDSTATPHLLLAALVRAGLEGIKKKLPVPKLLNKAPDQCTKEELADAGAKPLPRSLNEALALLDKDAAIKSWFPKDLWTAFFAVKRTELKHVEGMTPADIASTYHGLY